MFMSLNKLLNSGWNGSFADKITIAMHVIALSNIC